MMIKNDEDMLNIQKLNSIALANRNVQKLIDDSPDILKDIVTDLCAALDKKDTNSAGRLAYQVKTYAPHFQRKDLTNMAEFLGGVLKIDEYVKKDEIYKLFFDNFSQMNTKSAIADEKEQEILLKTRKALQHLR